MIRDRRDWTTASIRAVTHARDRRLISPNNLDLSTRKPSPPHDPGLDDDKARNLPRPDQGSVSLHLEYVAGVPLFLGEPPGDVAPKPKYNMTAVVPEHRPKS